MARDTVSDTQVILIVVLEYNYNLKTFLVFKSPGKGDEHSGFHSLVFRKPWEQIIETTEAPSKWISLITVVPFGS